MPTADLYSVLPDTVTVDHGAVYIDGYDLSRLAEQFGTPLYVYDATTLRRSAERLRLAFAGLDARLSFAAKSCEIIGVLGLFQREGLDLDVVSLGEIEAGLRAGFRPEQMHLHGNFKSDAELERAVELGLHAIVVDNLEEIERLQTTCQRLGQSARLMLRLALPLEAETHPHLQTSGRSKFGMELGGDTVRKAIKRISGPGGLDLIGLHTHLGSQISDASLYGRAARRLLDLAAELRRAGHQIGEISVGGGWAVPYRPGDPVLEPDEVAAALVPLFGGGVRAAVEPGRALVAHAGVAMYRVGSVKWIGERRFIVVDGGMGDNPRPALYGARYIAVAPEKTEEPLIGKADVVGRYCESGDVLAQDVALPEMRAGDLVAVPVSGAYHLSMASAYNLVPPPAAVLLDGGLAKLILRRATVDDLLARDMVPEQR